MLNSKNKPLKIKEVLPATKEVIAIEDSLGQPLEVLPMSTLPLL
jgi:hypothetical protein